MKVKVHGALAVGLIAILLPLLHALASGVGVFLFYTGYLPLDTHSALFGLWPGVMYDHAATDSILLGYQGWWMDLAAHERVRPFRSKAMKAAEEECNALIPLATD